MSKNDVVFFFVICLSICRNENNEEINDFFSFDWDKECSSERKLRLKNGKKAYFTV